MKYTGRISAVLFTWVNFFAWTIYIGHTLGIVIMILFLVSGVFQTIVAWWLGLQYDKAQFYSHQDVLTNTYTRRFIYGIFPKLRAETDRNQGKFSMILLDADKLKDINDRHGHHVGDLAIQHLSDVLCHHTRTSDWVARWGGDELLMIASATDGAFAQGIVERICEELKTKRIEGTELVVTASMGVATYPDDGTTLDALLSVADQRMYQKKGSHVTRGDEAWVAPDETICHEW